MFVELRMNLFSTEKIKIHTCLQTNFTFHLGALSSLLRSLTEVLGATLVITRMLDLDVLEPDLMIGNGLVASAGNEDVLSLNEFSESVTISSPTSDRVHLSRIGNKMAA